MSAAFRITPSQRNFLYLALGLLAAVCGLTLVGVLHNLILQVMALLLLFPAAAWMAMGICRLAKPIYFSVGFPELPRTLRKEASVRGFVRFTKALLFVSVLPTRASVLTHEQAIRQPESAE